MSSLLPYYDQITNTPGGAGGNVEDFEDYAEMVIITKPSDLSGILDSSKVYFIDGIIDMSGSGVNIEVPLGGLTIKGHSFDISGITCSDNNYTMFTSPVGGSGNLLTVDVYFESLGINSKVFNLTSSDGFGAVEHTRVNFNNCTSLGMLNNYRQGLEDNTGRFGGTPTLELEGNWIGGYRATTVIVRSLASGMTDSIFKAGPNFTMNNRFLTDINIDLPANASLLDFDSSNFTDSSLLQLQNCQISRNGVFDPTDGNITPNINAADLKSIWKNNIGIDNTYVGGRLTVSAEISSLIVSQNTFIDLAGTFTPTQLEHFDSPSNGQIRHVGKSPRDYQIRLDMLIDGPPNNELEIKLVKWDDSLSVFEDVSSQKRIVTNSVGGRDVAIFNDIAVVKLDENDYVKTQIANNTGIGNVTAEAGGFIVVSER